MRSSLCSLQLLISAAGLLPCALAQDNATIVVVNGATYDQTPVAPLTLAVAFGTFTGTSQASASPVPAMIINGLQVLVNGQAAPVLYVSERQVNFIVPGSVRPPTAKLEVRQNGTSVGTVDVDVVSRSPLIFLKSESGNQSALIVNSTGGINSESNPAPLGSQITLYATGLGTALRTEDVGAMLGLEHTRNLTVEADRNVPGLWAIRVVVPLSGIEPGLTPLAIHAGGNGSNTAALYLRR